MKQSCALLLLAVLPVACVSGPSPDVVAPPGASVALGQRVLVGQYVVQPISVYEDSRCPSGVRCIWAGRFILHALVDGPGVHAETYLGLGRAAPAGRSAITLVAVTPERFAEVAPKPDSYRFVFTGG